jgi:uncharacterized membrane-anchored protein
MEKKHVFLLIALFWIIIIVGFIAMQEFTLQTGKEVLLKTVPVDPRDLFRGDYVILSYEISTIDLNEIPSYQSNFVQGDKLYLSLNIEQEYATPVKVSKTKPEDGLFIKGKVIRVSDSRLSIEYGIESYFVPEGKGYQIESLRRDSLDVKAAIDKFGDAGIINLIVDGKVFEFDDESGKFNNW